MTALRPWLVSAALLATPLACRRAPPAETCFVLDAPAQPVGFDAPIAITVRPGCPQLRRGRIEWRQTRGPTLRDLRVEDDGARLTARMPALADVIPAPVPWGIIPISPRTQGEVVLEAIWRDGSTALRREARVVAAPRARGLPNTPVDARVHLGGEGWTVRRRPDGSTATLAGGRVASLLPDVAGDWLLADGAGRTLALRTARHDQTPLDCGRADCHPTIAKAAETSPMTTVLARGLADATSPRAFGPGYPDCALACHATGEPGLSDGGFTHVAGELGATIEPTARWEDLPRPLRRLGGVGCLACHGPAAVPEASARWSVLRADVCAVCHDAPPRYGHVAAWRATAMARADRDPRTRANRGCARCHTGWGFLGRDNRRPPEQIGAVGIACAVCHAVHEPRTAPPAPALLRQPALPALLAAAGIVPATATRVCLPCHSPAADAVRPEASSAAVWAGRGGLEPATGRPLDGPAVHAAVAGGCTGCHAGAADPAVHGGNHSFAASPVTCTGCHKVPPPVSDPVARARRLWSAATGTTDGGHAAGARVDRGTPRGRALWNVLLVMEDRGAAAHNPAYARALLDAATPVLGAAERHAP